MDHNDQSGCIQMIIGPMFAGKCLGLGTPVLLAAGPTINVEDVIVGAELVGDNFESRTVTSVTSGEGELYHITQAHGMPYVVNVDHILTLYSTISNELVDIPLRQYLHFPEDVQRQFVGWRVTRSHSEFHTQLSQLTIYPIGIGKYYGFTLAGTNGRFLLGDNTVTHNTTELIRVIKRYAMAKQRCIVLKYSKDTRYHSTDCCTHDQKSIVATPTLNLFDCLDDCMNAQVVAIDEAQFFPDIIKFCEVLANAGKTVVLAALDSQFDGKPFGDICNLVAHTEHVMKLSAVCDCGRDAYFTVRTVKTKEVELIGGQESYKSMCRICRTEFLLTQISSSSSSSSPSHSPNLNASGNSW